MKKIVIILIFLSAGNIFAETIEKISPGGTHYFKDSQFVLLGVSAVEMARASSLVGTTEMSIHECSLRGKSLKKATIGRTECHLDSGEPLLDGDRTCETPVSIECNP